VTFFFRNKHPKSGSAASLDKLTLPLYQLYSEPAEPPTAAYLALGSPAALS